MIARRQLVEGERVVVSTRTHVKALLVPAVVLIVLAAVAGFVSSLPSGSAAPFVVGAIWLVAAAGILRWVLAPSLRWLTTTYTVTDRRIMTRAGVFSRRGHDTPIARITDVGYEHGLVDRLLGCGTLVVYDASEHGEVRLTDIPDVEQVQLRVSELLLGPDPTPTRELWIDDGR